MQINAVLSLLPVERHLRCLPSKSQCFPFAGGRIPALQSLQGETGLELASRVVTACPYAHAAEAVCRPGAPSGPAGEGGEVS